MRIILNRILIYRGCDNTLYILAIFLFCINSIEGFWSQLKRSINGTYHFVNPKHLQAYVNEFSFRYNRRNDLSPMFKSIIALV